MAEAVLDASAVLALVASEPGAGNVLPHLTGGRISAVNLAEVLGKLTDIGMPAEISRDLMSRLGFAVEPFDGDGAAAAAALRPTTRKAGLSLGDRSCLALAQELALPVITADRSWADLDLDVDVVLVR